MSKRFESLLKPGTIGKMELKNRIVMPPMVRNYATPDGIVTRRLIDHYAARARGGVGLVIVEATFVHPAGKLSIHQPGIHHNKCIQRLSDLASALKEWGSKVAIQLHHAGRQTSTAITDMTVVAPSAIPCPVSGGLPRELTTAEVADLVEDFAQAARRAQEAGFDAVEIHGAHGYLISQFLSQNTNRRTDKYGGDIYGRMTFLLEIIQRVKEVAGSDFPVTVRLNGRDYVKGGLELDECRLVAMKLEDVGVDGVHITTGTYEARLDPRVSGTSASMYEPRGHIVNDAAYIKSAIKLPVITVGSITPEMGEEILQQGKADFIAMGRALLADADLPNKLLKGEPENVRPCIRCNEFCRKIPLGVKCSVNAEVGFESYGIVAPLKCKKVLIAGGGPAGMEAARVAALRGHEVTLYEKTGVLGGHLLEAIVPDFKKDLKSYQEWLVRQVKLSGVKVELGKEVTTQTIKEFQPDTLVIATGSAIRYPDVPGAEKPSVTSAISLLLGKDKPGDHNIIVGGGALGCETALYLAQQGKKVTIIEMLPEIVADVSTVRGALYGRLMDKNTRILLSLRVVEITDTGVVAIDDKKDTINIEGDRVVLAIGLMAQAGLYEEFSDKVPEVYLIGDSVEPRRVGEATRDGYRVGSTI